MWCIGTAHIICLSSNGMKFRALLSFNFHNSALSVKGNAARCRIGIVLLLKLQSNFKSPAAVFSVFKADKGTNLAEYKNLRQPIACFCVVV